MPEKEYQDRLEAEPARDPNTIVDWILDEHRRIEASFDRLEQSRGEDGRPLLARLIREIADFIAVVEAVFHPAVRGSRFTRIAEPYIQENLDDHQIIRRLLERFADLRQVADDQLYRDALRLRSVVDHMVSEEESGLVSLAEDFLDDQAQRDACLEISRRYRELAQSWGEAP